MNIFRKGNQFAHDAPFDFINQFKRMSKTLPFLLVITAVEVV